LTTPLLRIRLVDLDRGKSDYDWELPVEWLNHALAETDAKATSPGRVTLTASKDGLQVILHGRAQADVTMPCARTFEPVAIKLNAEIVLVLHPAPTTTPAVRPHRARASKNSAQSSSATTSDLGKLSAKSRKMVQRPETELTLEDAAEDFYHGEQIDLDELVREFLILELPMMPLRSDLRFEGMPAISATPGATVSDDADFIDPRLRPLAEIARRLKKPTKE
jgi:uncharacterized protein